MDFPRLLSIIHKLPFLTCITMADCCGIDGPCLPSQQVLPFICIPNMVFILQLTHFQPATYPITACQWLQHCLLCRHSSSLPGQLISHCLCMCVCFEALAGFLNATELHKTALTNKDASTHSHRCGQTNTPVYKGHFSIFNPVCTCCRHQYALVSLNQRKI